MRSFVLRSIPALLVLLCATASPARAQSPRPAPAFAVRTMDGKSFRLAEFKGRPVVLDFWATWCKPCRASMPHLETVQKRYEARGLVVMGLSVDQEEPLAVKRFAQKLGISFRIAMADEKVLDLYGPVRSILTTFIINRNGEVVRRVVGYIDLETLDGYVQELF